MMAPRTPPLRIPGAPLGLVPFTVPGWPTDTSYLKAFEQIACRRPVSFEFALPSDGWSFRTNEVIARALNDTRAGFEAFTHMALQHRPNVAVIYEGSANRIGRAALLARLRGTVDHIMLEWEPETHTPWAEDSAQHGIGLVTTVEAGGLTAPEAREIGRSAQPGAIVYLKCAEKTAGPGCSVDVVRAASDQIKACRQDIFVMAGFGIREPEQVRALAGIDSLDAAAVGTALLERFMQSADAVGTFYGALSEAAGSAA